MHRVVRIKLTDEAPGKQWPERSVEAARRLSRWNSIETEGTAHAKGSRKCSRNGREGDMSGPEWNSEIHGDVTEMVRFWEYFEDRANRIH